MLVLYEHTENGPKRMAELRLGADGHVSVKVLEHTSYTDSLADGVPSIQERRLVLPEEGEAFLEAVRGRATRATYWMTQEEED